jgi:hypothetical protein
VGLLLSPSQKRHREKGDAIFWSPEAVALRNDPDVGELQEIALLEHYLRGDKELVPRYGKKESVILDNNGEVVREGFNELPGFELIPDEAVQIDPLEAKEFEIKETLRYMAKGEEADAYRALDDDKRDYIKSLIEKHLYGGAIDKQGERGTTGRVYPLDYAVAELRNTPIPAVFENGQKRDRGTQLLLDKIEGIDRDTGVGTYGTPSDALHREAAANKPELLTAIDNIRNGNSSLNQSVKSFTGEELANSLNTRLNRLIEEQFFLENGVRPIVQTGSVAKRENLAQTKYEKLRDANVNEVLHSLQQENFGTVDKGERKLTSKKSIMKSPLQMAGTRPEAARALELASGKRTDSPGDSKERALYIDSGGGDVTIGHDVLRSNGNGKHKNGNGH